MILSLTTSLAIQKMAIAKEVVFIFTEDSFNSLDC